MLDVPCAVSIDERNHDAGYASRCQQDSELANAKAEFIAAQVKELMTDSLFDCFIAADTGQEELLKAFIGSTTLQDMTHTHDQFVRFIEAGATIIAERLWQQRELTVATMLRNGWWSEQ